MTVFICPNRVCGSGTICDNGYPNGKPILCRAWKDTSSRRGICVSRLNCQEKSCETCGEFISPSVSGYCVACR